MAIIKEIRDNIETRMANILGSDYSKLSYVVDITDNTFKGNSKRYGVRPLGSVETDGQTCSFTMDHSFQLYLVDSYNSGALAQVSDDLKADIAVEMQDLALEIYNDLAENRSTLSTTGRVFIVNQLNIEEVEYIEESKIGILRFDINIKYKR